MFTKETDKKIFAKGGKNTFKKYGNAYMKLIGKKGGRPKKVSKPTVDNFDFKDLPNNNRV